MSQSNRDAEGPNAASSNTVTICPDGPLEVCGSASLVRPGETPEPGEPTIWLCRCGASNNKPFCDGSHSKMGFSDAGTVDNPVLRDDPRAAEQTELEITLAANGPLIVKGPMELIDGGGETVATGTRAALCRCGASENKPFCDGAHNRVGFDAP